MEKTHLALVLSEWLLALGVVIATLIVTTTARSILQRVAHHRERKGFWQLAPTLSYIFYIIGLRVFADVAPLNGKVWIWLDGSIYVLSIIIYLALIQRAASIALEWSVSRASSSDTLKEGFIPLVRNVITLFVFLSAGIMVLKHFNYDVMSLLTALGVGSLAVGLASKDTLSNMISGFILIIDRNLRPGDRINLNGNVGDLVEIGLRSTRIKLPDGNILIVPNSDLVNTKIINLSMPTREVLCSVQIRVPYSASFSHCKSVCIAILADMDKISKNRPQAVNLQSLHEGNQLIQITFWVPDWVDANTATSIFNERLISKFKEETISLSAPLPEILTLA